MSMHMKCASGVLMVLLSRVFTVARLDVMMLTSKRVVDLIATDGKADTARLCFCGRSATTIRGYVAFLSLGSSVMRMKRMVLVPALGEFRRWVGPELGGKTPHRRWPHIRDLRRSGGVDGIRRAAWCQR
jgi:hypothetical protein